MTDEMSNEDLLKALLGDIDDARSALANVLDANAVDIRVGIVALVTLLKQAEADLDDEDTEFVSHLVGACMEVIEDQTRSPEEAIH